ncbi:MAG: fertility inhibition FinO-like protein [Okeania sp. SIO2C9]|uniref:fertility inhibition FinO-like protein n=1 Tax=Okeania sp. SIO2C9 TaxID=2607791 RepID=UPI0013C18FAE|nr:fertility inhibition FinO-like protein [Okeania sp. SIO2C9]NEQ78247.1 fertility inhibition FinO-like protein [Okeania sp. SIO2C9]
MTIAAKMEVVLKISELPESETVENGWQYFEIDSDGIIVSITVKPKIFKKLTQAAENYPQWVAAITGKMGESTENGFKLENPAIQVFEKKPKAEKSA